MSVLLLKPELQNRNAGRVVFQHLRRKRAWRHVADLHLALRHDLRQRQVHLRVRMEVHADDRDALVGLRLDVLDADDVRGQRALDCAREIDVLLRYPCREKKSPWRKRPTCPSLTAPLVSAAMNSPISPALKRLSVALGADDFLRQHHAGRGR